MLGARWFDVRLLILGSARNVPYSCSSDSTSLDGEPLFLDRSLRDSSCEGEVVVVVTSSLSVVPGGFATHLLEINGL
jgi:hypothetical protein